MVLAGEVGAGGRRRLKTSFALWLKLRPGRRHLCSAAKAFAASLLDSGVSAGADGDTPTTQQVLCDSRYDF